MPRCFSLFTHSIAPHLPYSPKAHGAAFQFLSHKLQTTPQLLSQQQLTMSPLNPKIGTKVQGSATTVKRRQRRKHRQQINYPHPTWSSRQTSKKRPRTIVRLPLTQLKLIRGDLSSVSLPAWRWLRMRHPPQFCHPKLGILQTDWNAGLQLCQYFLQPATITVVSLLYCQSTTPKQLFGASPLAGVESNASLLAGVEIEINASPPVLCHGIENFLCATYHQQNW